MVRLFLPVNAAAGVERDFNDSLAALATDKCTKSGDPDRPKRIDRQEHMVSEARISTRQDSILLGYTVA
ncbi:MAG: hypothetical protein V1792_14795 [Pseudomonadota bacterium]